jgi:hypothetical protein
MPLLICLILADFAASAWYFLSNCDDLVALLWFFFSLTLPNLTLNYLSEPASVLYNIK